MTEQGAAPAGVRARNRGPGRRRGPARAALRPPARSSLGCGPGRRRCPTGRRGRVRGSAGLRASSWRSNRAAMERRGAPPVAKVPALRQSVDRWTRLAALHPLDALGYPSARRKGELRRTPRRKEQGRWRSPRAAQCERGRSAAPALRRRSRANSISSQERRRSRRNFLHAKKRHGRKCLWRTTS